MKLLNHVWESARAMARYAIAIAQKNSDLQAVNSPLSQAIKENMKII
jgi:hypothetical protein